MYVLVLGHLRGTYGGNHSETSRKQPRLHMDILMTTGENLLRVLVGRQLDDIFG